MLSILFVLAAASVGPPCPASPSPSLLARPYDAFDTAGSEESWRTLLARGCTDTAVATLIAYRDTNQKRMTREQRGEINFHMGQALAMAGRNSDAIPHFEEAAKVGGTVEWQAYVAAHLGYVRKDRTAVEKALADYERVAPPNSMRVGFIRGFLRCIDKPYMAAVACGG